MHNQKCKKCGGTIKFEQGATIGICDMCGAKQTMLQIDYNSSSFDPLLKRVFMFLEDGNWEEADTYCEKVLDKDPENAHAYLGKLMAELRVSRTEDLVNRENPFDDSNNFQKAIRFGEEDFVERLNNINENVYKTRIYNEAVKAMETADKETEYTQIAEKLQSISGFGNADVLAEQCLKNAEECRLETERKAEKHRISAEKTAKMIKRIIAITVPAVVICVIVFLLLIKVILPSIKYNSAVKLYNNGNFEEAISAFEAMNGYKDSMEQITECKYASALKSYQDGKYFEAISAFEALDGYKDSAEQITECKYASALKSYQDGKYSEAISAFEVVKEYKDSVEQIKKCKEAQMQQKYDAAVVMFNNGKYNEAISAFEALNGYKDSAEQIKKCKEAQMQQEYKAAVVMFNNGKYNEAISAFEALNGYKDSAEQIEKCKEAQMQQKYDAAIEMYNNGRYNEAISAFEALNGYKDSEAQLEKCYIGKLGENNYNIIKKIKVGDTYKFGKYKQAYEFYYGDPVKKEEIEWIVLEKNGLSLLLISKYSLDSEQYNDSLFTLLNEWESCTLRKWLNNTFLNEAFSAEEKRLITLNNETNDNVFLLSSEEAKKYFKTDKARTCKSTDYGITYVDGEYKEIDGHCFWWLRDSRLGDATWVAFDGSIHDRILTTTYAGVRPVIRINLAS